MNQKRSLKIVKDYRGSFYSRVSNKNRDCSLDLHYLVSCFSKLNWTTDVIEFADCINQTYDCPILITSSEDGYGLYKGFIETIAIGLEMAGATVVPRFEYLQAHHNKIAMEQIRFKIFPEQAIRLNTSFFGCYEELKPERLKDERWPKVFKTSSGAGAAGVRLVNDFRELNEVAKKMSRTLIWPEFFYELGARIKRKNYHPRSLNRSSFLVQNFIDGLASDYKVLVYGKRYYVLKRFNRKNDFRASGSGNFSFDELPQEELLTVLNFSRKCFCTLRNPVLSMDVALAKEGPILIEFQAVYFGPLTAEKSRRNYTYENGSWIKNEVSCDLESVFADAIVDFFEQRLPFSNPKEEL